MKTLNGPATAALGLASLPLATLVDMALTVPLRLNTSGWNLVYAGNTYQGVGVLGGIEAVDESPGDIKGLRFSLSGVPSSQIALALSEQVQGKAVTVYTAIFDRNTYQVLDTVVEWAGRLDVFNIIEEGDSCVLAATAEHAGIDLLRPNTVRYSNADQVRLFPGDVGFQYVIDQSDVPIVWPSRDFYRQ